MPRPREEDRVRELVCDDLREAEAAIPPGSVSVNPFAVSQRTHVHRKTLERYGLNSMIRETAERIRTRSELMSRRERVAVADRLTERDSQIATLQRANLLLLARVALAEANCQRLGVDPAELWKPMTPPPRATPYVPSGKRRWG